MSTRLDSLFYELELRAGSFDQGLKSAEASAGRFTSYMSAHPMAVVGLLGAALVTVGIKATQMAAEVDTAVRRISGALPEVTTRFDEVKGSVRDLSLEFGVGQPQIAAYMKVVAEGGVDSVDGMVAMTRAALVAAEAVGDLGRTEPLIQALDSTLDVFGLSATDSEAILAKLLVTAQGKGTIEDLTGGFGRLAIKLREAKVDFITAADATATLIARGASARTAVAELGEILEKKGAAGLKELAAQSHVASDGLKEMRTAAERNGESIESMHRKLKENLNASLIELGSTILPIVLAEMRGLIGLIDLFNGSVAKVNMGAVTATVASLAGQLKSLKGEAGDEVFNRLEVAISKAAGGTGVLTNTLGGLARSISFVGTIAPANLKPIEAGLVAIAGSGRLSERDLGLVVKAVANIRAEIAKRGLNLPPVVSPDAAAGVDVLTAAQRRAVQASTDLTTEQKNTILTATALSDTMKELVAKAMKEAATRTKEAGDKATEMAVKYAAAMKKVQDSLIKSTVTLVDDTEAAMQMLREELVAAGVAAEDVDKALQPMNDQLRLISVNEQFKLPEILERAGKALTSMEVAKLKDAQTELRALYSFTLAGTQEHVAVGKQLEAVQKKITEATKDTLPPLDLSTAAWKDINRQAGEIADRVLPKMPPPLKSSAEHAGEIANKIADVAQGALGVAQTFGVVDSKSAAILANVINIGRNLGDALGGDPSAIIGVLGSLAGVISGIFGDSAEGRARKQLIKENTAALADLTEEFGNFGSLKSTGTTFSKVQEVLGKELAPGGLGANGIDALLFGTGGQGTGLSGAPGIIEQLKAFGISLKDIEVLAGELGITLRNKETGKFEMAGFRALLEALGLTEFSEFANTFKGQMDRVKLELETGVLDPTEEFGRLLAIAGDSKIGSPAIAKALEGIDLTTAEGRDQGIGKLRDLIKNLPNLSAGEIGLSQGDFADLINRMLGILTSDRTLATLPLTQDRPPIATEPPPEPTTNPPPQPSGSLRGLDEEVEAANWDVSIDQGATQISLLQELVNLNARLLPLQPPILPTGFGFAGTLAAGKGGSPITVGTINILLPPGAPVDADALAGQILAALQRAAATETTDIGLSGRVYIEQSAVGRFPAL